MEWKWASCAGRLAWAGICSLSGAKIDLPTPAPRAQQPSRVPRQVKNEYIWLNESDLWKEAYENIRHDPDDSNIYADFREILNTERGRGVDARLSSESGRKELLTLIDQRRDNLAARRASPKVQRAFTVVDKGRNDLHNAARYGQTAEVFRLVSSGQCTSEVLNPKTARGWTPLMFAVENGHFHIMDMLLECQGMDINVINSIGRNALYMAAIKNRVSMVRRLLQMNANVDVRDHRGRTDWLMIAMPGHLECLKLLRAAGAVLNQTTLAKGYNALHGAVERDQVEVVRWLAEQGIAKDIRITNGEFAGMTAADMASCLGRTEIVDVLQQAK